MKHFSRLVLGSVSVAILIVGSAVPASTHAQLESTGPAQSSVLSVAATQAVLHLGESVAIDSGSLRVLDPSRNQVDSGAPTT